MASKMGLMRKQEAATNRLREATARLRDLGVDVGPFPDANRDRDSREVERLEHVANLLESAADRIETPGGAVPADDAASDDAPVDDAPADATGDAPVEPVDYERMTVAELKALLQEREIAVPADARKADLIALLSEADAADSEEEGDDDPPADPADDTDETEE